MDITNISIEVRLDALCEEDARQYLREHGISFSVGKWRALPAQAGGALYFSLTGLAEAGQLLNPWVAPTLT